MTVAEKKYYPSKRDLWLVLLTWFSAIVLLMSALHFYFSPLNLLYRISWAFFFCGTTFLCIWVVYSTCYYLTAEELVAISGPFHFRVPLEKITQVAPNSSMLSGPACSLDRLQIDYTGSKWGLLVSPKDKDAFLQAILEHCSHLEQADKPFTLKQKNVHSA